MQYRIISTYQAITQSDELAELNKTLRQAMLVAWQRSYSVIAALMQELKIAVKCRKGGYARLTQQRRMIMFDEEEDLPDFESEEAYQEWERKQYEEWENQELA